jgi:CelD/BcsL family acetyltransferase involved in cellulose biosynthesis
MRSLGTAALPSALPVLARQGTQGAAAGLSIEAVRDRPAFDALGPEWRALEERSDGAVFFQSFDWCRNYLDHMAHKGGPGMLIVAARSHGSLVALLPLAIKAKPGFKVVSGLAEPFQQYTEMLADPGCDLEAVFAQMLPVMRAPGADCLHLGQVRAGGPLHRAMAGMIPPSGEADGAPFVPMGEWPDFAAYHKTVNAKTRKNMRAARNRLERDGEITHEIARSGPLLAAVIDRTFEGREAWLERQGLTSRAFRSKDFAAFLDSFKDPALVGVETIAFSLKHAGRPIADQWGFLHKRRYYAFMACWDEAYKAFSPGKMQLGAILESCHAEGIDIADFLIPAAPYKMTWAHEAVPVQDHVLPLTLKGRAHNSLWLNATRPLAKKAVEAMPAWLRGGLVRTLMRSLVLAAGSAQIAANLTLPGISG